MPILRSILGVVANPSKLYEWAGGSDALSRMINAFYDRVEGDELLSPFFPGGGHEDHRRHRAGPSRAAEGDRTLVISLEN